MQQVSLRSCGGVWEKCHSWVCFPGTGIFVPPPHPCLCSVLTFRHFQEVFRAFMPVTWRLLVFFSPHWASLSRWGKHEKLFYLQLFYCPVYAWSVIFTSIRNIKEPTGYLRFVATPWNQWREKTLGQLWPENLGHNVTMMCFSALIEFLITSMMQEKC